MPIIIAKPRPQSATIKVANVNNTLVPIVQTPIVLSAVSGAGANRLDQMIDVDESQASNNSTLVYNEDTDEYEVRQISIDGGTF